jgi:hypothetical protein
MKLRLISFFKLALVLLSALFCVGRDAAAANNTATARPATNAVMVVAPVPIPLSVFVVPASPKDGRNPFFPLVAPPPVPVDTSRSAQPVAVDTSLFVLKGITSPPRATALINNRTFEPGEEGEVRLPNGAKELVKCEQVKSESAVIIVRGERHELRLRSGL